MFTGGTIWILTHGHFSSHGTSASHIKSILAEASRGSSDSAAGCIACWTYKPSPPSVDSDKFVARRELQLWVRSSMGGMGICETQPPKKT